MQSITYAFVVGEPFAARKRERLASMTLRKKFLVSVILLTMHT